MTGEHRAAVPAAVLIAVIASILFSQSLSAQQQKGSWVYYKSNAVGMALEKISPEEAQREPEDAQSTPENGPPEFILKKRTLPSGIREEVLLHSGEEIYTKRIEKQGKERVEREFREGEKAREIIERSGRPVYEWEMGEDKKAVEREYRWDGEELLSCTEKTEGEEKEIIYLSGTDGRLGQVRENGKITSYVHSGNGDLEGEWISREDKDEIISYGPGGQYSAYIWDRDEQVRSRTSIPEDGSLRVIRKDKATGEETTEIYDADNRLKERKMRKNGVLTRETYTYTHSRISEKKVRSPNRERIFLYSYNPEGDLEEVDVRENGRRIKKILYHREDTREDTREEIIYRNEKPLYRDVYRGEELILRESVE
ncbi:MAG: hypothetical protein ACLFNZ_00520 [Spirochaetaceae bacterium]